MRCKIIKKEKKEETFRGMKEIGETKMTGWKEGKGERKGRKKKKERKK